jgi:SAM-dependent methyltransferase
LKWVKEYYHKQFLWSKTYTPFNMETLLEDLVDKLERFSDHPPKTILELGGGNGQFAVSAAYKGFEVTMMELVPACVEHTYELARKYNIHDNLRVIQGDFYQVEINESFDVVCYWNGFGIGEDSDQQLLLNRISNWLKPGGTALIDVYTPWYWAKTAGQEMHFGNIFRQYGFDAIGCRMLDTWWLHNDENHKIRQSLRCYSPGELEWLLKDTDLTLVHCEPGGAMDYENWRYTEQVSLDKAMTFMAKLQKAKN